MQTKFDDPEKQGIEPKADKQRTNLNKDFQKERRKMFLTRTDNNATRKIKETNKSNPKHKQIQKHGEYDD